MVVVCAGSESVVEESSVCEGRRMERGHGRFDVIATVSELLGTKGITAVALRRRAGKLRWAAGISPVL
eukprot:4335421-Heterocapsa_arctica.AAC.1